VQHLTIGFIGAGNMARALAAGLIGNGWERSRVLLADPDEGQRKSVSTHLGATVFADSKELVRQADLLVFAVKPQILKEVAKDLAGDTQQRRPLVVSIAAGIRTDDVERWLGGNLPVVRVMPNTPALIGSGAAGLYANQRVDAAMRDQAEHIMRAVGVVVWLNDENLMDVVTALSGSGPAYFFLIMELLEQAAIRHGLDRKTARLLTLETAFGAAKMALEGAEEPAALRLRVTSPGGTTEAAIGKLVQGGLDILIDEAVAAAINRSRELADLFKDRA